MKLKEAINFKNGKKKPDTIGDIPIYGGNGILGFTDKSNTGLNNIIVGRVGAYCGCVYKDDNKCWISDNAIVGNVNNGFDYKYMYYKLKSLDLNKLHIGSSHPLMTQDILNNIELTIPQLEEQKKIGNILNLLDKKIEENNQTNDNLLEIIDTLYKENFNDIDVYDKAENIADISIGKTPPRKEKECFTANANDVKWISISDLGKSRIYIFNTSEKLTMDSIKKYNVKVIPKGTIILSFKLTIGKIAITTENMATNEAIAHFNLKNEDFKYYLYSYLKNFDYAKLGNTSSIATAVNSKIIKAMPIGMPNEMTINNYNKKVKILFEKILENEKENQVLEQLRDTLLPKLMNGEINLENI